MAKHSENQGTESYLVLGGNGFIGSHIVDRLVQEGKKVKVLDPFRHEPQFNHVKRVDIMAGSAFDPLILGQALEGITHVIYSLAATNPFTADTDPYADIENLRHGVEILENCVQAGVRKIAFISSGGAVYGKIAEAKTADENDVPSPVSPYGICKLSMEHYMEYFKRKYGLEYVAYRLSNPYGPRQAFKKEQGVIPAFLKHISQNEEITIYGDGSASRDYIFVEDAARMIADTVPLHNKFAVYNVGSGQQTTLKDIIETIENVLQIKATINFEEAPLTTLQSTGLSIERFHSEFGANEIVPFAEGLKKTINYFWQKSE